MSRQPRWIAAALWMMSLLATAAAQEPAPTPPEAKPESAPADSLPAPPGLVQLSPDSRVWVDLQRKQVVVDGKVALRQGQLEMFACPKQTKEHESVVAVDAQAFVVHAGLLAIGAKAGHPVSFEPEYRPASGSTIEVWVLWRDEEGNQQKVRAQEWIRNVKTGEAMQYEWVFAGSKFFVDPGNGQRFYQGDGGDFICVSNFPTATLDLPVESSQANTSLLYEAYTERIPPRGTLVRLVLSPRPDAPPAANEPQPNAAPAEPDQPAQKSH